MGLLLLCLKVLTSHVQRVTLAWYHITSHDITSHLITTHHITSYVITSHDVTSYHMTSHDITPHDIATLHYPTRRHCCCHPRSWRRGTGLCCAGCGCWGGRARVGRKEVSWQARGSSCCSGMRSLSLSLFFSLSLIFSLSVNLCFSVSLIVTPF